MPDDPKSNDTIIREWTDVREAAAEVTPEAAPEAAPAADTPAPEHETPRRHDGTFAPKGPAASAPDAPAPDAPAPDAPATEPPAPATPPPAGASAQAVQDYLEATVDGATEPFRIPKGAKLALKRGTEVELVPIEELQRRGMLEKDYRTKTAQTAAERRQLAADRAELAAQRAAMEEEAARVREATTDPQKAADFEEHQRLYQENPWYKQAVDDARAKRMNDARDAATEAGEAEEQTERGIQTVMGWLEDFATRPEYAGVDVDRVRLTYSRMLQDGNAGLDPRTVESLFKQEADYLNRRVAPLQEQLAALTATVEELKATAASAPVNTRTAHALTRAKAPPVATTGQPAAPRPVKPAQPFGIRDLAEKTADWARQRD